MANNWATAYDHTEINDVLKNGKFGKIITVSKTDKAANFCSADEAYTSDDQCIQAAINHCATTGIKNLWIFEGVYNFVAPLTCSADIDIHGFGKVVFNESSAMADDFISFSGTVTKTISALADVAAGASSITISDISNVHVGDSIIVYDNTIWGTDYSDKTGEIHEISSISGTESPYTISFTDGLLHAYTTAQSAKCIILAPISATVDNIHFSGLSSTVSRGAVSFLNGKRCHVKNCVINSTGLHGVVFTDSFNCSVSGSDISNCEWDGNGYGVSVSNACAHISVFNNRISLCRHCVASGGTASRGQPREYDIYDNTFFGGSNHIADAHPCVESMYVHDNIMYDNTRYALTSGARNTKFYNNVVYNGLGCGVRGATTNMVYIVENNLYHGVSSVLDTTDDTVTLTHVTVAGNKVFNGKNNIIYIKSTQSINIVDNFIDKTTDYYTVHITGATCGAITNNTILNSCRSGITLSGCSDILVDNNTIKNSDTGNSGSFGSSGIYVYNSNNLSIHTNKITDVNGYQRYGIREDGTSNNNIITDNPIAAGTVSKILKLGAGTIVNRNNGYTTENTGTATIQASGTSIVVSHGLAKTPTNVIVTPRGNIGSVWVDPASITSTQFTIRCSTAPASNTVVGWSAVV